MPRTTPNLVTNGIVDLDAFLVYLKSQNVTPRATDEKKQKSMREYRAQRRRIQKERRNKARQAAPQARTGAEPGNMVDAVNEERLPEQEAYMTGKTADAAHTG